MLLFVNASSCNLKFFDSCGLFMSAHRERYHWRRNIGFQLIRGALFRGLNNVCWTVSQSCWRGGEWIEVASQSWCCSTFSLKGDTGRCYCMGCRQRWITDLLQQCSGTDSSLKTSPSSLSHLLPPLWSFHSALSTYVSLSWQQVSNTTVMQQRLGASHVVLSTTGWED